MTADERTEPTYAIIDRTLRCLRVDPEERRLAVASSWTLDEIPAITSEDECAGYRRRLAAQEAAAPAGVPLAAWLRTPDGMIATALGVRITAWEKDHA